MSQNINRVTVTGNLTRDPELRNLPSGTAVCSLRIAVNGRRKDQSSGEWVDDPNYFDVTVWGGQGENCAQYLSKGRPVAIDGRLDWREWQTQDGDKRQSVQIVADSVQFLGARDDGDDGQGQQRMNGGDVPADTRDMDQPPAQSAAEGLPSGKTPATPDNIKRLCLCPDGFKSDDCPIEGHGVPF